MPWDWFAQPDAIARHWQRRLAPTPGGGERPIRSLTPRQRRRHARAHNGGTFPSHPWRAKTDCMASSGSSRWSVNPPARRGNSGDAWRHCERQASHFSLDLFAGKSPASERFLAQLRHAAQSSAPLWLVGEPGSGKETAARAIHHSGSSRERAFVAVDCVALQPFLVESLLFGLGGLLSSGPVGTLYLKDPVALPRDLQQRLADHFMETANAPRLISGSPRAAPGRGRGGASGERVPHRALSPGIARAAASGTDGRPGEVHFIPPSRKRRSRLMLSMSCAFSVGLETCANWPERWGRQRFPRMAERSSVITCRANCGSARESKRRQGLPNRLPSTRFWKPSKNG